MYEMDDEKDMAIIRIETNQSREESECYKRQVKESFAKKTRFIKTVLAIDDKKLDLVKVKDMPKMLEKAEEIATIGHMKTLIEKDSPGIIATLAQKICCIFRRNDY